jgi:hypothetical protein
MEWKDKIGSFKQIDVRGIQGNFFQGIKKQAMQLPVGNGLEIVSLSCSMVDIPESTIIMLSKPAAKRRA